MTNLFDSFEKRKEFVKNNKKPADFTEKSQNYEDFLLYWKIKPFSNEWTLNKNQDYYISSTLWKKEIKTLKFLWFENVILIDWNLSEFYEFQKSINKFIKNKELSNFWFTKTIKELTSDIEVEFDDKSLFEENSKKNKNPFRTIFTIEDPFGQEKWTLFVVNTHFWQKQFECKMDIEKIKEDKTLLKHARTENFREFLLFLSNETEIKNDFKYYIKFSKPVDFTGGPSKKVKTIVQPFWYEKVEYKPTDEWFFKFFMGTNWTFAFVWKNQKRHWFWVKTIPLEFIKEIELVESPSLKEEKISTKTEKIIEFSEKMHPNLQSNYFKDKFDVVKENKEFLLDFEKQNWIFKTYRLEMLYKNNAFELYDFDYKKTSYKNFFTQEIHKIIDEIINNPSILKKYPEETFTEKARINNVRIKLSLAKNWTLIWHLIKENKYENIYYNLFNETYVFNPKK